MYLFFDPPYFHNLALHISVFLYVGLIERIEFGGDRQLEIINNMVNLLLKDLEIGDNPRLFLLDPGLKILQVPLLVGQQDHQLMRDHLPLLNHRVDIGRCICLHLFDFARH